MEYLLVVENQHSVSPTSLRCAAVVSIWLFPESSDQGDWLGLGHLGNTRTMSRWQRLSQDLSIGTGSAAGRQVAAAVPPGLSAAASVPGFRPLTLWRESPELEARGAEAAGPHCRAEQRLPGTHTPIRWASPGAKHLRPQQRLLLGETRSASFCIGVLKMGCCLRVCEGV